MSTQYIKEELMDNIIISECHDVNNDKIPCSHIKEEPIDNVIDDTLLSSPSKREIVNVISTKTTECYDVIHVTMPCLKDKKESICDVIECHDDTKPCSHIKEDDDDIIKNYHDVMDDTAPSLLIKKEPISDDIENLDDTAPILYVKEEPMNDDIITNCHDVMDDTVPCSHDKEDGDDIITNCHDVMDETAPILYVKEEPMNDDIITNCHDVMDDTAPILYVKEEPMNDDIITNCHDDMDDTPILYVKEEPMNDDIITNCHDDMDDTPILYVKEKPMNDDIITNCHDFMDDTVPCSRIKKDDDIITNCHDVMGDKVSSLLIKKETICDVIECHDNMTSPILYVKEEPMNDDNITNCHDDMDDTPILYVKEEPMNDDIITNCHDDMDDTPILYVKEEPMNDDIITNCHDDMDDTPILYVKEKPMNDDNITNCHGVMDDKVPSLLIKEEPIDVIVTETKECYEVIVDNEPITCVKKEPLHDDDILIECDDVIDDISIPITYIKKESIIDHVIHTETTECNYVNAGTPIHEEQIGDVIKNHNVINDTDPCSHIKEELINQQRMETTVLEDTIDEIDIKYEPLNEEMSSNVDLVHPSKKEHQFLSKEMLPCQVLLDAQEVQRYLESNKSIEKKTQYVQWKVSVKREHDAVSDSNSSNHMEQDDESTQPKQRRINFVHTCQRHCLGRKVSFKKLSNDIHFYISTKLISIVREKLKNTQLCYGDGLNCFIVAAKYRQWSFVKHLLDIEPRGINARDENGAFLIEYFAGDLDVIWKLIKLGANIYSPIVLKTLKEQLKKENFSILRILDFITQKDKQFVIDNWVSLVKNCSNHYDKIVHILKLGYDPKNPYIIQILKEFIVLKVYNAVTCEILDKVSSSSVPLVDEKGVSLLEFCCENENIEILVKLIDLCEHNNHPKFPDLLSKIIVKNWSNDDICNVLYIVAANDIPLVDQDGISLLKHAAIAGKPKVMKRLLKLGADPMVNVPEGFLCLILNKCNYRDQKELFDVFKTLVVAGHKLLPPNNIECSILCHAIVHYFKSECNDDIIKYILIKLAFYKVNLLENCKKDCYPQESIIKIYKNSPYKVIQFINLFKLLNDCNLLDIEHINMNQLQDKFNPCNFGFISEILALFGTVSKNYAVDESELSEILKLCVDAGFNMTANSTCISPLTVILSRIDDIPQKLHAVPSGHLMYKIKNGCKDLLALILSYDMNVEQKVLQYKDSRLERYSRLWWIPDACLALAGTENHLAFTELALAKHMAYPPLTLLMFIKSKHNDWFLELLKYGRIPHGTLAYVTIKKEVALYRKLKFSSSFELHQTHIGSVPLQDVTIFDVIHKSPLTLIELSRCAVRVSLAETVCLSNSLSLPKLYKSLILPLKEKFILEKIKNLINAENGSFSLEYEIHGH